MLSNHEEADTRMMLHAKHASLFYRKVLISSPDTDVFVILLSVSHKINASLFFLTGVQNNKGIIIISDESEYVSEYVASNLNPADVEKAVLLETLVGLHSFTGCDTTSSFAGKGKIKPFT